MAYQRSTKVLVVICCELMMVWGITNSFYFGFPAKDFFHFSNNSSSISNLLVLQASATPRPVISTSTLTITATKTFTPTYTITPSETPSLAPTIATTSTETLTSSNSSDDSIVTKTKWGIIGSVVGGLLLYFLQRFFGLFTPSYFVDFIKDKCNVRPTPTSSVSIALKLLLEKNDFAGALDKSKELVTNNSKYYEDLVVSYWKSFSLENENRSQDFLWLCVLIEPLIKKDFFRKGNIFEGANLRGNENDICDACNGLLSISKDSELRKTFRSMLNEAVNKPQCISGLLIRTAPLANVYKATRSYWRHNSAFKNILGTDSPFFPISCEDDYEKAIEEYFITKNIDDTKNKLSDFLSGVNQNRQPFILTFNDKAGQTSFVTWFCKQVLLKPAENARYFPIYIKIEENADFEMIKAEIDKQLANHLRIYFLFFPEEFSKHNSHSKREIVKLFLGVVDTCKDIFHEVYSYLGDLSPDSPSKERDKLISEMFVIEEGLKKENKKILFKNGRDTSSEIIKKIEFCYPMFRSKLAILLDFDDVNSYADISKSLIGFSQENDLKVLAFMPTRVESISFYHKAANMDDLNYDELETIIERRFAFRCSQSFGQSINAMLEGIPQIPKILHSYILPKWIIRSGQGCPGKIFRKGYDIFSSDKSITKEDLICLLHIPENIVGESWSKNNDYYSFLEPKKPAFLLQLAPDFETFLQLKCRYGNIFDLEFYEIEPSRKVSELLRYMKKETEEKFAIILEKENNPPRCIILDQTTSKFFVTIITCQSDESIVFSRLVDDLNRYYNNKNDEN